MDSRMLFVIIAAVMVVVIAVVVAEIRFRRAARRRKEEEIRKRARQERAAEARRVAEVKRLAHQDEIGDRIFQALHRAWKLAWKPENLKVLRIRHNAGSYYIQLGGCIASPPVRAILWISIDLSRPAGKEVFLVGCRCHEGYQELIRQGEHWGMPIVEGENFILKVVSERLYGAPALYDDARN